MAEIGGRSDVAIDVNLLRHMVINTIRSHKLKFEGEYGEVVIACDSKNYWRKQVFPYYKANRKKAREESKLDWAAIFDAINLIKKELTAIFPFKVIEVEGAEADDIIASLVYWSLDNDVREGTLIPDPKPLLIISGDHDFNQLQKYKHVKQFSPVLKKFVKAETTPEEYIIHHIIRGDKGDGVPNVLSNDDSIVSGERQTSISTKKLEEWIKDPTTMPTDDNFKRNYHRNKTLVDLSMIPKEIQEQIINTFTEYPLRDKGQLLNYFMSNRMKQMIEHIQEF
jgi:5'-3' exonuclease